jgi:translation initiation factor IF-1
VQADRRSVERPRIALAAITRESVRELVETETEHLRKAVTAGRNRYQVRLDQHDQIVAYMATLNPLDLERFSTLYEQEAAAARAAAAKRDEWRPLPGPLAVQAGHSGDIMRIGPWALAAAGVVAAMATLFLRR